MQRIVEKLGGIWTEVQAGEGSMFYLTWPVVQ
jgi:hypothetical protein